jgi:D-alanine transaminase
MDVLYFNGRFTTTDERVLGVEDRGFLFGDAVYEVFKFLSKQPVFFRDHWRRLARNLDAIEIRNPWTELSFMDTMRALLERTAFANGIVYIQVSRGEGPRTHFYPDDMVPTVIAYSRMFKFPDPAKKEHGVQLITTVDRRWKHCDVKSVNLLANALAKKEAQRAGADEALLVDEGMVREGASSNFFAVRRGRVITHPLDEHILPGVTRDHAITVARKAGIPLDEGIVREDELGSLDEAFISSTTLGVMPVVKIGDRPMGGGVRGPLTAQLQRLFDDAEARGVGF